MASFQDKSVLVLGGSRGIGAAIVRRFATEGAAMPFTYAGSRDAAERLSFRQAVGRPGEALRARTPL